MRSVSGLTLALLGVLLTATATMAQASGTKNDGWKSVKFCSMIFSVPETLKDNKAQGIDSCVASLSDKSVSLSIDYGLYSGVSRYDHYLDYEERDIVIGGRKGSIATYRDSTTAPEKSWVGRLFIVVEPPKDGWPAVATNMFVVVGSKAELSIAERIIRSIKFNKSPR
jgi:hypothetical protein